MDEKGADESDSASWLVCRVRTHLCALPLTHVVEVMRLLPIRALSGTPPHVRGLCIMRGAPVPVIDAGCLMDGRASRSERLVAIRIGGRRAALAVDAVIGVRKIGARASDPLPPLLGETANNAVAATGILDTELVFFLRADRIVPEDLFDRLGALENAK